MSFSKTKINMNKTLKKGKKKYMIKKTKKGIYYNALRIPRIVFTDEIHSTQYFDSKMALQRKNEYSYYIFTVIHGISKTNTNVFLDMDIFKKNKGIDNIDFFAEHGSSVSIGIDIENIEKQILWIAHNPLITIKRKKGNFLLPPLHFVAYENDKNTLLKYSEGFWLIDYTKETPSVHQKINLDQLLKDSKKNDLFSYQHLEKYVENIIQENNLSGKIGFGLFCCRNIQNNSTVKNENKLKNIISSKNQISKTDKFDIFSISSSVKMNDTEIFVSLKKIFTQKNPLSVFFNHFIGKKMIDSKKFSIVDFIQYDEKMSKYLIIRYSMDYFASFLKHIIHEKHRYEIAFFHFIGKQKRIFGLYFSYDNYSNKNHIAYVDFKGKKYGFLDNKKIFHKFTMNYNYFEVILSFNIL